MWSRECAPNESSSAFTPYRLVFVSRRLRHECFFNQDQLDVRLMVQGGVVAICIRFDTLDGCIRDQTGSGSWGCISVRRSISSPLHDKHTAEIMEAVLRMPEMTSTYLDMSRGWRQCTDALGARPYLPSRPAALSQAIKRHVEGAARFSSSVLILQARPVSAHGHQDRDMKR